MSISIKPTPNPEPCSFVIPITLSVSLLLQPEVEGSSPACHPQGSKSNSPSTVTSASISDERKTETSSPNLDIVPESHSQDTTVRAVDEGTLADANSPFATHNNYKYDSFVDLLASWLATVQEKILRFSRSVLEYVGHTG
jgi:hypothetical protein